MTDYYKFKWNICMIDFMTVVDVQYYDEDGNYSIDYQVETQRELPLMLLFQEPFNVVNFPAVYNYLTADHVNYSSKNEYLRWIIHRFGELILIVESVIVKYKPDTENVNKDNDIEGYQ